jgi:hypothetical protein
MRGRISMAKVLEHLLWWLRYQSRRKQWHDAR